ncbi:hypothetical protein CL628_02405 [bacterium]|nr:hypothetical protein [bacterium]|tara:strand:- start:161 stop:595 length:435 start_codon:yes stop_codon:yes gene_type:complete
MYQHLYIIDTVLIALLALVMGGAILLGVPFAWWMVPTAVAVAAVWDFVWHQIAHRNHGSISWQHIVGVNVPIMLVVILALGLLVERGNVNFFWWQTLIVVAGCSLYDFAWHGRDHHSFGQNKFKILAFSGAVVLALGMLVGVPF